MTTEPSRRRSTNAEDVLRDTLASIAPIQRLTYRRHWFAGLSVLPGDGVEYVDMTRSGDNVAGTATIEFRSAFGRTAISTSPIAIQAMANRLDAVVQALASLEIGWGDVGFTTEDVTEREQITFELANGKKLAFEKGYGAPQDFWGYIPVEGFIGSDTSVIGVRAPGLSAIAALLDKKCGLRAQTNAQWKMLNEWSLLGTNE